AGVAPRRPEVEDDRLAAVPGEVDHLVRADGLQGEGGRGAADERRVDVLGVLPEREKEDGDQSRGEDGADTEDSLVHACSAAMAASGSAAVTRRPAYCGMRVNRP